MLAVLLPSAWLIADHRDRRENEARLAAIASGLAGRPVGVRCPGPLQRVFGWDVHEGFVRLHPDGTPFDETQIRQRTCGSLDALAEGRAGGDLACIERTPDGWCGADGRTLALAVDVLAHESEHLRGERDEGLTECRALQQMTRAAQALGATAAQGHALAVHHLTHNYELAPDRYRAPGCTAGGVLDLTPGDGVWP